VLAGLWTLYADGVKEDNPLTQGMTSRALQGWNFGTVDQHLDPVTYAKIIGRIGGEIAGPLGLGLLLAVVGIALAPRGVERARRAGWLAVAVFSPLVFLNLYYVHNYYLIAVLPALAASVALGITAVAERMPADASRVVAAGTALVLVGSAVTPIGWNEVRQWWISPVPNETIMGIREVTPPDSLIVVVGCTIDPQTLYLSDRRGMNFPGTDSQGMWSREDIDDYDFLFSCDPTIDTESYLPDDRGLEPTSVAGLSRIVRREL
jgi:hypothetical protein